MDHQTTILKEREQQNTDDENREGTIGNRKVQERNGMGMGKEGWIK